MSALDDAFLSWEFQLPPSSRFDEGSIQPTPDWLADLQNFRGRILYENGRRPAFLDEIRGYLDADPLDLVSYHLLVRDRESRRLIGCARVSGHFDFPQSMLFRTLGNANAEQIFQNLNVNRADVLESSRWILEPKYRTLGIGSKLVWAFLAVGQWVQAKYMLGIAGTRNGQADILKYHGGSVIPQTQLIESTLWNDQIQLLHLDLRKVPEKTQSGIDKMRQVLGLSSQRNPKASLPFSKAN